VSDGKSRPYAGAPPYIGVGSRIAHHTIMCRIESDPFSSEMVAIFDGVVTIKAGIKDKPQQPHRWQRILALVFVARTLSHARRGRTRRRSQ
jgi:hypothetical protein